MKIFVRIITFIILILSRLFLPSLGAAYKTVQVHVANYGTVQKYVYLCSGDGLDSTIRYVSLAPGQETMVTVVSDSGQNNGTNYNLRYNIGAGWTNWSIYSGNDYLGLTWHESNNAVFTRFPQPKSLSATETSFSPTTEELETFKIGFWTVVGFGLFALIMAIVRRIGAQNHGLS